MARYAEDSEDELPELGDIFKGLKLHTGGAQSQLPPSRTRSPVEEKRTTNMRKPETINKRRVRMPSPNARDNTAVGKGVRKENTTTAVRRRVVLNKKADNPLLRPLQPAKNSPTSSRLLSSTKSTDTSRVVSSNLQHILEKSKTIVHDETDESSAESDGMSSFIVDDSSLLSEAISEPSSSPPIPRSTRRLVRGRKIYDGPSSEREAPVSKFNTETPMDRTLEYPPSRKGSIQKRRADKSDCAESGPSSPILQDGSRHIRKASTKLEDGDGILETHADFEHQDPSIYRVPGGQRKETRFLTPPSSPTKSKAGLMSPSKKYRIPLTPHRPSMDSFWSQEIINEWNDEFSPKKPSNPTMPSHSQRPDTNSIKPSPKKGPIKNDKAISQAKKIFSQTKERIASDFVTELDNSMTSGQVSSLAAATGGVKIIWSKTLKTTAGRANWKREAIKTRSLTGGTDAITYRHHASIELAEKVIDDEDRLLNVLAHEYCHLANFMISGVKNNPHGKEFKAWASKCTNTFRHRGIEVTTKHSYTIEYKYIWECTACGLEFKRHSKSIDPTRHQCGKCKNKLVQTKPVPKMNASVNQYQLFVKENMKIVKELNPKSPQKEIMALVGKRYQEFKALKVEGEALLGDERGGGKLEDLRDDVDLVARKLDFLDLTSP